MDYKLIIRNLRKDRFYTLLNVLGLAVGIAMAVITFLYLQNELSYDQHFEKSDRIFRVSTSFERPSGLDNYAISGIGMGELMAAEYSEIEAHTTYAFRSSRLLYEYEEKAIYLDDILLADSNVFKLFEHDFIYGNPAHALNGPNKIVLSESVAKRFFGDENPIGKIIVEDPERYEVTGVFKDLPDNTHFKYGGLMSTESNSNRRERTTLDKLTPVGYYVYILLKEGTSIQNIQGNLDRFVDRYDENPRDEELKIRPIIQPLSEIHFYSTLPYDQPFGNINYIYSFFIVGCLVLLLAAINYINLTTARAVTRAKEVGIKKVIGVTRSELVIYFLSESMAVTMISGLAALGFVEVMLNLTSLNQILEKNLELNFLSNPSLVIGFVVLMLGLGLLAGLYPALYLSGIQPIGMLKGNFKNSKSGLLLRKSLVVFQFVISIGVVSITLLMIRQIDFLRNSDLGFAKENLMTIALTSHTVRKKIPVMKEAFMSNKNVLGVTSAREVPGIRSNRNTSTVETQDEGFTTFSYNYLIVGKDYIDVMDMELLEGRDFDPDRLEDRQVSWIANEAFVKKMGWETAKGKRMRDNRDSLGNYIYEPLIGVVKNFNIHSLHQDVYPTVLYFSDDPHTFLHIRIAGQDIPKTIDWIRNQWTSLAPNAPFEFSFMDDTFDKLYNSDERQSKMLTLLSLICAIISCLGLFGLTSYNTEQRKKEMGVRKVLGANTSSIIALFFKDIIRIVLISTIIALPITYWAYQYWSESFAYREAISYPILGIVAIGAIIIAFATIAYHSLRLANSNPIESLRTE